jgi:hypothetical protein
MTAPENGLPAIGNNVSPVEVALADLPEGAGPVRDRLDERWVAHLMEVHDRWPPILLTDEGLVLDGCHRVEAARRLGRTTILAVVSSASTQLGCFIEAARANAGHGLRLTRAERSAVAKRLLVEAGGLSDRRIARIAGVSPTTVGTYRRQLGERVPDQPANEPNAVQLDTAGVQLGSLPAQLDDDGAGPGAAAPPATGAAPRSPGPYWWRHLRTMATRLLRRLVSLLRACRR